MSRVDVIGVGYQGLSVDRVCEDLVSGGVAVVCDVRLTPLSRKPGLSKTALSSALSTVGVEYLHLPVLGNPKWNRGGFGGSLVELHAARQTFLTTVLSTREAQDAVDQIRELALGGRVALLCFESDESRCHRSVILDDLLDERLSVAAV
jgi:uncharacterized protein (DUF488 family)